MAAVLFMVLSVLPGGRGNRFRDYDLQSNGRLEAFAADAAADVSRLFVLSLVSFIPDRERLQISGMVRAQNQHPQTDTLPGGRERLLSVPRSGAGNVFGLRGKRRLPKTDRANSIRAGGPDRFRRPEAGGWRRHRSSGSGWRSKCADRAGEGLDRGQLRSGADL